MSEQELREELERVTQERDEAVADAASAGIDADEIDSLRASNATAEEALTALREKVAEGDTARALSAFTSKRDNAIVELGLPADHPAIPLAFPDDTVLDDETFAARLGSLKGIAALGTPKPSDPPDPNLETEPPPSDWNEFRGAPAGDGAPPSELTQAERQTLASRKKYSETRNPRDLVGALGNTIMRIVTRKTPGNQKYYEKERVQ